MSPKNSSYISSANYSYHVGLVYQMLQKKIEDDLNHSNRPPENNSLMYSVVKVTYKANRC